MELSVVALAGDAFTFVVVGTVAFSLVMSLLFLVTKGSDSLYDQIGAGGLSREGDQGGAARPLVDSPAAQAEREREIRQMLRARSERRVRAGEQPLDIDAEVARLLATEEPPPAEDPGLVDEVRQMVLARNERRARRGEPPLDVEAEVTRTLSELQQ